MVLDNAHTRAFNEEDPITITPLIVDVISTVLTNVFQVYWRVSLRRRHFYIRYL